MASIAVLWLVMTAPQKTAAIGYARSLETLARGLGATLPATVPSAATMNDQTQSQAVGLWEAWYNQTQPSQPWLPPLGFLSGDGIDPAATSPATWSALLSLATTRDGTPAAVRSFMTVQTAIWSEVMTAFGSQANPIQTAYQRWWFNKLGGANANTGAGTPTTQGSADGGFFGLDGDTLMKGGIAFLLFKAFTGRRRR